MADLPETLDDLSREELLALAARKCWRLGVRREDLLAVRHEVLQQAAHACAKAEIKAWDDWMAALKAKMQAGDAAAAAVRAEYGSRRASRAEQAYLEAQGKVIALEAATKRAEAKRKKADDDERRAWEAWRRASDADMEAGL